MQNTSAVKKSDAISRAEKLFRKQQLLAEAPKAWAEYHQRQAATLANMERLRALRLSQSGKKE